MTEGVRQFLSGLGLSHHFDMFVAKGFDLEEDLPDLSEDDLNCMYISDNKTRRIILEAAKSYKLSQEFILYEWLRSKGLDHYFICFIQSELVDLASVQRLNLPDEQIYDELEITLPGHKRRLERAVRDLCKKQPVTLPNISGDCTTGNTPQKETPVAHGRWGKPRCLQDAKYDFLLLDATVVSTLDARDRVDIEFMVDSGSDVVTIRQIVLDTMDLELIGPINSKGVHASRVKNIYKANILVGNESLEVEVMGESYDSIGSRVLRHFRHYITGSSHVWLKGDYVDPTVSPRRANIEPEVATQSIHTATNNEEICEMHVPSREEHIEDECFDKQDHQEHSSSPEESAILQSNRQEEEAELDLHSRMIQSDAVKSSATDLIKYANENATNIEHEHKIDFKFISSHPDLNKANIQDQNNEHRVDETDKLMHANNGIIDVRPIIAANRKRHASNNKGFDPGTISPDRQNGKIVKKNKTSVNGERKTIAHDKKRNFIANKVDQMRNEDDGHTRTVMNHRSVYYRSRVKDVNDECS